MKQLRRKSSTQPQIPKHKHVSSNIYMENSVALFILNLLLLGGGQQQQQQKQNGNLIDTTCKVTPNYQLCLTVLKKDPRSSGADIGGLGLIVVDALKNKTEETVERINTLKKASPELRGPLNRCGMLYYAVLKADVPEAVEALKKGVPKFAEDGMADAEIEAQECERAFELQAMGGLESPLSAQNKAVQDLSNVARAIIRMLL